jgi:non-heme chloroperoxidase
VNVNNDRLILPDGALMHIEDWGDGPPVVFTHGWTAGWEMWEYQMSAVTDGSHRCLRLDRRGCGRSTAGRAGFGYDELADGLASVLEARASVRPRWSRTRWARLRPSA